MNFSRKKRSNFKGSVTPAAETVLKPQRKRQNKAAEKNCYCESSLNALALLLHFNLALTVTTSLLTYTSPTLLMFTDRLSGVTPHTKEPDAPSPVRVGKPQAQKREVVSVTRGADSRGLRSSHLRLCAAQGNTVRRVILFTGQRCSQKPLQPLRASQCPHGARFGILQKH